MIKYSDASHMDKIASGVVTSQDPIKNCCATKVANSNTKTGEHTCECGNKLAVIREEDI